MYLPLAATLTLFIVAAFSSQNILAQELHQQIFGNRPDFSGKWSIDIAKSRFSAKKGPMGKDVVFEVDIRQNLPLFSVRMHTQIDGGLVEDWKNDFYTDGRSSKEHSGESPDGRRVAKWENSKLILQTYDGENTLAGEEHFELLPGGNTLQITFKLTEGRWGYSPNPPSNVIDEQYSDYLVFNIIKK